MSVDEVSEELFDLDAAPDVRQREGWGRAQTLWLTAGILGVVAVIVAVLAWPEPAPAPQVPGLQERPTPAWSAPFPETAYLATCGADRVLIVDGHARAELGCLDLEDGSRAWATSIDGGAQWSWISELPGTGFLEARTDDAVVLLDRDTGEEVHRIALPAWNADATTMPTLLASDRGTMFWAQPSDDPVLRNRVVLSRLTRPDPASGVWEVNIGSMEIAAAGDGRGLVEHHGYVWFPEAASTSPSFTLAVDLEDGTTPDWALMLRTMVFQGATVIGSTPAGLAAHDIGSGRLLWERDDQFEQVTTDGAALFIAGRVITDGVVSATGEQTWPLSRIEARTAETLWSVDLRHPARRVEGFGDSVLVIGQDPSGLVLDAETGAVLNDPVHLSMLDAADGTLRWTREFTDVSYSWAFMGENQVLLATGSGDDWSLLALDEVSGETRWETRLEGHPTVLGQRMVVVGGGRISVHR